MIDLLLLAFLQTAEQPGPAPVEMPQVAAPAETVQDAETRDIRVRRRVCRVSPATGSRLRRERVCQTQSQRQSLQDGMRERMGAGPAGNINEGGDRRPGG